MDYLGMIEFRRFLSTPIVAARESRERLFHMNLGDDAYFTVRTIVESSVYEMLKGKNECDLRPVPLLAVHRFYIRFLGWL